MVCSQYPEEMKSNGRLDSILLEPMPLSFPQRIEKVPQAKKEYF